MLSFDKIINEDGMLNIARKEFNNRLARVKKADTYFKNPNTTEENINKHYDEFIRIFDEMIRIGKEIERYTGKELTIEEIENGFVGVEHE